MKGQLFGVLLTDDRTFDFFEETQCKGAVGLSIRNIGQTDLIIDDDTQEKLSPGDYFFVENSIAVVNRDFRVKFKKENGKVNKAVLRYVVPLE